MFIDWMWKVSPNQVRHILEASCDSKSHDIWYFAEFFSQSSFSATASTAKHLLKYMQTPGLPIGQVFKCAWRGVEQGTNLLGSWLLPPVTFIWDQKSLALSLIFSSPLGLPPSSRIASLDFFRYFLPPSPRFGLSAPFHPCFNSDEAPPLDNCVPNGMVSIIEGVCASFRQPIFPSVFCACIQGRMKYGFSR